MRIGKELVIFTNFIVLTFSSFQDGISSPIWQGFTLEQTSQALIEEVLEKEDSKDSYGDLWKMSRAILNFLLHKPMVIPPAVTVHCFEALCLRPLLVRRERALL